MIICANLVVIALLLVLMVMVARQADRTLPQGQLPLGRMAVANSPRWLVLGFLPSVWGALLIVSILASHDAVSDLTSTVSMAAMALLAQQAQLWDIRRIMQKKQD